LSIFFDSPNIIEQDPPLKKRNDILTNLCGNCFQFFFLIFKSFFVCQRREILVFGPFSFRAYVLPLPPSTDVHNKEWHSNSNRHLFLPIFTNFTLSNYNLPQFLSTHFLPLLNHNFNVHVSSQCLRPHVRPRKKINKYLFNKCDDKNP